MDAIGRAFALFQHSSDNVVSFSEPQVKRLISDARALLIAVWLGAALFFIAVAQTSFSVLPSSELAGAVVNRTLSILNLSGLVIGAVLFLSSFLAALSTSPRWLIWIERLLLALFTVACGAGQFLFAFWLSALRARFGGKSIDELAADDPLRLQFDLIHQYSVWVLSTAMIAALIVFFFVRRDRGSSSEKSAEPDLGLPPELRM